MQHFRFLSCEIKFDFYLAKSSSIFILRNQVRFLYYREIATSNAMTITLKDNPVEEAAALRDLMETFRRSMKLLRGRPHVTACQLKAVGTMMEVLDDVEAQLPAVQPDTAVALAVVGGVR